MKLLFSTSFWQFLYHLSYQGSLRILEWVAYPFSNFQHIDDDYTELWIYLFFKITLFSCSHLKQYTTLDFLILQATLNLFARNQPSLFLSPRCPRLKALESLQPLPFLLVYPFIIRTPFKTPLNVSPLIPSITTLQESFNPLLLSHVRLSVTPWSVAHQAPLVHGFLQARMLEWVAMPSSRGSSPPRDWTCISRVYCLAGGFLTSEPPGKSIVNTLHPG